MVQHLFTNLRTVRIVSYAADIEIDYKTGWQNDATLFGQLTYIADSGVDWNGSNYYPLNNGYLYSVNPEGWFVDANGQTVSYSGQKSGTCLIYTGINVVESVTGQHIVEDDAIWEAWSNGYYGGYPPIPDNFIGSNGTGTTTDFLVDFLTNNVPGSLVTLTHPFQNVHIENIAGITASDPTALIENYLAVDKIVMATVDANELWEYPSGLDHDWYFDKGDPLPPEGAVEINHQIWLNGFERDAQGDYWAIITDSGTPNGMMAEVPWAYLAAAWDDEGYYSIVADLPADVTWHNVLDLNVAPVITGLGSTLAYTENAGPQMIDGSVTITDPDNTAMVSATIQITGNYQNGEDVLSFTNTGTITGAWDTGTGTLTLTGSDTLANYQAALTAVKYQDTSDNPSTLDRTVTWTVYDGTDYSAPQTSTITVTGVNDAPVAVNDSYATDEETALTVAGPGVLANDTDVDGDSLSALLLTGPSHGTVTLNANGSFTYTPTANYNGADSFTYQANDGTADSGAATVSITVNPVNDPPSGADKTITMLEDGTYAPTAVDFGFSDLNDSPVNTLASVKITSLETAGALRLNGVDVVLNQVITVADINAGYLTFAPALNDNGTGYASFGFAVTDDGGTANGGVNQDPTPNTITFNVNAVNDSPVISLNAGAGALDPTFDGDGKVSGTFGTQGGNVQLSGHPV